MSILWLNKPEIRHLFLFRRSRSSQSLLYPFSGIYQRFHPGRDFISLPAFRIIRPVPGLEGAFHMGHNGQMPAIIGGNPRDSVVRAVGIGGILLITVVHADMIVFLGLGKLELAFSMGYPYPEPLARQRGKHDRPVFRYVHVDEGGFELMAVVVLHPGFLLMGRGDETQFRHQLASVTDAET